MSTGILTDDETPAADGPSTGNLTTSAGTEGPTTTTPSSDTVSSASPTVTYTRQNSDVLSLTSTGNDHQWALVRTKDPLCTEHSCATVFARDADGAWSPLGVLPGPADNETGYPDDVAQLRFVARRPRRLRRLGVRQRTLQHHTTEAATWTTRHAEAGVVARCTSSKHAATPSTPSSPTASRTTTSSSRRSSSDDWQIVDTTMQLDYTNDLVVTKGVVAMIGNSGGDNHRVVVERAPIRPPAWPPEHGSSPTRAGRRRSRTCRAAANVLWALCTDGAVKMATVSGDGPPQWNDAAGPYSPRALIAARSTTIAVLAEDTGLVELSATGTSTRLSDNDFSHASLLGFTNDQLGFADRRRDAVADLRRRRHLGRENVLPAS